MTFLNLIPASSVTLRRQKNKNCRPPLKYAFKVYSEGLNCVRVHSPNINLSVFLKKATKRTINTFVEDIFPVL